MKKFTFVSLEAIRAKDYANKLVGELAVEVE